VVVSAVFLSASMSLLRMFFRAVLGCCHDVLDVFLYVVRSFLLIIVKFCLYVAMWFLSGCYGVPVDC